MHDTRRYRDRRKRAGMDLAQDRGTQRMRHQPGRFAIADQNVRTHRVLNLWNQSLRKPRMSRLSLRRAGQKLKRSGYATAKSDANHETFETSRVYRSGWCAERVGLHRTRASVCISGAGLSYFLPHAAILCALAGWSFGGGSFDADRHAQEHHGARPDRGHCATLVDGRARTQCRNRQVRDHGRYRPDQQAIDPWRQGWRFCR